ncbi:hypothetical protein PMAYCL1PPCAC_17108, partial [Pristionchus mayeri]
MMKESSFTYCFGYSFKYNSITLLISFHFLFEFFRDLSPFSNHSLHSRGSYLPSDASQCPILKNATAQKILLSSFQSESTHGSPNDLNRKYIHRRWFLNNLDMLHNETGVARHRPFLVVKKLTNVDFHVRYPCSIGECLARRSEGETHLP